MIIQKLMVSSALVGVSVLVFVLIILFAQEERRILRQPVNSWSQDQSADCAIVLTGAAGRIREGFDLLANHHIKKLIIAGVDPHVSLREIFPLWPLYARLKSQDVVLERRSRTTYGNAQQSIPLVAALGCRDLLLVTSTIHMFRALRTFRAAYPPDFPIYPCAVALPALKIWEVPLETIKSLFYSLFAY